MNLSYGITNRNDDFLPCDIIHDHLNSKSLSEIRLWFDFIKQKNKYKKIILLGHSRGGLNMAQFYSSLSDDNKEIVSNIIITDSAVYSSVHLLMLSCVCFLCLVKF